MKFIWWTLMVIFILICCSREKKGASKNTFLTYCGSCHLAPDPKDLPKSIWAERIIPEMGARLGIRTLNYDPFKNLPKKEWPLVTKLNVYAKIPLIAETDWNNIKDYILENAPDSLVDPWDRANRNQYLKQFKPLLIDLEDKQNSFITYLSFPKKNRSLYFGDAFGHLRSLVSLDDYEVKTEEELNSPLIAYTEFDDVKYLTEMGDMPPSEFKLGKLWQYVGNKKKLIIDSLHRPVHTLMKDLNNNGKRELLISEYGNFTGQLTLFYKDSTEAYVKKNLLDVPGIIRAIPADMNNDNSDDLVVLAAQGNEGVYILYQKEDLVFSSRQVIRFSPVYGSSWIELIDYDHDGDQDIITVQGDNADFSYVKKLFHGVRLFINEEGEFIEKFFYPIYGATRAVMEDFDQDGDFDLAVIAFFPDFMGNPEESFVYLENVNASNYKFKSYTFPESIQGRWIVMESGDIDEDGDFDIVLGSFPYSPTPTPKKFLNMWDKSNVDIIVLKNLLIND